MILKYIIHFKLEMIYIRERIDLYQFGKNYKEK